MSRRGNCYDNAVVESFFGTLKTELIHHHTYAARNEAHLAVFEHLEGALQPQTSSLRAGLQ